MWLYLIESWDESIDAEMKWMGGTIRGEDLFSGVSCPSSLSLDLLNLGAEPRIIDTYTCGECNDVHGNVLSFESSELLLNLNNETRGNACLETVHETNLSWAERRLVQYVYTFHDAYVWYRPVLVTDGPRGGEVIFH